MLRQSVFGRPAAYEDVNDAERLRYELFQEILRLIAELRPKPLPVPA